MKKSMMLVLVLFFLAVGTSLASPAAPQMTYSLNGLNITVGWTAVPDATNYTLYFAPYPYAGSETVKKAPMGGATSYSVGLWEGAAYYVAVTASNASGEESVYSNIKSFIVTLPSAPGVPVLSSQVDGFELSLSWTEIPGVAGYKLYYASVMAPEVFHSLDMGAETSKSYHLWQGAAYYVKVASYAASGVESNSSNTEYFIMGQSTPKWVDNGNGTVTDHVTGLVWQQHNDNQKRAWQPSADYCSALSLGGSSGWRLSNTAELQSLIDTSLSPMINPLFTGEHVHPYWSSDTYAENADVAFIVSFRDGMVLFESKTHEYYARCVR